MVILAAGKGQRLRPLTDERPKGLMEVAGKPLIEWQIEAAARQGLGEVAVVTGYKADMFTQRGCRWYHNPCYAETNMVETLWCAKDEFHGEIIVSYGDILYEDSVLMALIASESPISVVVDVEWRCYWEARFTDPMSDAESLRLNGDGCILEIGQKAGAIEEVQGQYIGLMKFAGSGLLTLQEVYAGLAGRQTVGRAGRPFRKMYMTDLLQAIIDAENRVQAVPVHRKWLEIDSTSDYELANKHVQPGPNGLRILI
jgi:choline kinase